MVLCNTIKNGTFKERHPVCIFLYFLAMLVLTMFASSPVLLGISLAGAGAYQMFLFGAKAFGKKLTYASLAILFFGIFNMLTSHNGVHVLCYLNDNRVTVESFIYGLVIGMLLSAVYWWFDLFQLLCDGEKLRFLFGKTVPTLALFLSMTLHYLPMLKKRMEIIRQAQAGMGRTKQNGRLAMIKQRGKEFSILMSWSLEDAIQTADVMTARGYGIKKRSCFHTYVFRKRDGIFLAVCAGLLPFAMATLLPQYRVYYYPTVVFPPKTAALCVCVVGYTLLAFLPIIMEVMVKKHGNTTI